jgi:hypothetical protein
MTNGHRTLFHVPRNTKIDTAARIDPPGQRQGLQGAARNIPG